MRTTVKTTTLLLLAGLIALLQGCGFQLRGSSDLPSSISPLQIQGISSNSPLYRNLSDQLRFSDIQVVESRDQAASQLRIKSHRSDRRVLSVDGNGNVLEYELHEQASFELLGRSGEVLVAEQQVSALLTYLNPETEVLGKQQEEQTLRRDMQRDLASQLLRRLQAQL